MELNREQQTAIKHYKGPMMALAGPGSGKTTVITHRVRYLIEEYGVSPGGIAVITFTRAAADEMKLRFGYSTNNTYNSSVMFGTFHSFFYTILRNRYRYKVTDILNKTARKDIVKHAMREVGISVSQCDDIIEDLLSEISNVKNELTDISCYKSRNELFRDIYRIYEQTKDSLHKIDYDDMLIKCYELLLSDTKELLLWQNKYKYFLIDEFQDINKVQYETVKLIALPENNLFIVGDDDQSIYRFRGARPEFLLKFSDEFRNVPRVTLNTNYRSTNEIVALSNSVISKNKNRYAKELKGIGRSGAPPVLLTSDNPRAEADEIVKRILSFREITHLHQIAVIYRSNIQSCLLVDSFFAHNIPFTLKDELPTIYSHFIANDICAFFRLSADINDDEAFEQIYYKPGRLISKALIRESRGKGGMLKYLLTTGNISAIIAKNLNKLRLHLNDIKSKDAYEAFRYVRENVGYNDYLRQFSDFKGAKSSTLFDIADELQEMAKGISSPAAYVQYINETRHKLEGELSRPESRDGVVLTTMHSAKGLEFDVVFVITANDGVIPHEKSITPEDIEEERRLFYVAITRARTYLYISTVRYRHSLSVEITPFIKHLPRKKNLTANPQSGFAQKF